MTPEMEKLQQDLREIGETMQRIERMVKAICDALGSITRLASDQSLKRETAARRARVAGEIKAKGKVA